MNAISAFFMQNIVYVYFFSGLAFFSIGLVVSLESTRASEFRFARALHPLAWFGFLNGTHEWFEMVQILIVHETQHAIGPPEELIRIIVLVFSFLCLLNFGARLLPGAERQPGSSFWQVSLLAGLWLGGVGLIYWRFRPPVEDLLIAADVLAHYSLGIPGALLAAWALLRERRDFHARGMSVYGQDLLWAALAFFIYGVVGQFFTRPSLVFPSHTINMTFFLRTVGVPAQLVRGLAGTAIALTLTRALRAFELESRLRLARANQARLEAQAAALEAQQRRANEVEALNAQLRATARELSAMVEMARILDSTMDLNRMLSDALYQVVHSLEASCCSVIFLKRPDGKLELAGKYQRPNAPEPTTELPLMRTMANTIESEGPLGVGMDGEVQPLDQAAFSEGKTYRTLAVPLHAKGHLLGVSAITSLREDAPLGWNELHLLIAFSQQVAASVENARLYQVLQQREAQLAELVRQIVNAQEAERQRIARELHDETGQKLTALAMGLAAVETHLSSGELQRVAGLVHDLRDLTDQSITELRNVMANLRPSQLDDLGLVPALHWYVQQYQARHPDIDIILTAEPKVQRLPTEYKTVLFRVTQEALTNVARHAHATRVEITLSQQRNAVYLDVADNGVGFDMNTPTRCDGGKGWGLVGIRERVAAVAGKCTVTSQKGRGTRISVELPLRQAGELGEEQTFATLQEAE